MSHADEDKEKFVRPLAQALCAKGLSVWFDDFTLTVGDRLRRSIDHGLARSRFGVVVISPHFLDKEWPQRELDGLAAREVDGAKVILPVWHNITAEQLRARSPMLADRIATLSKNGIDRVVDDLTSAILAGTVTSTSTAVAQEASNSSIPNDEEAVRINPGPGNGWRVGRLIMAGATVDEIETLYRDFMSLQYRTSEIDVFSAYWLKGARLRDHNYNSDKDWWWAFLSDAERLGFASEEAMSAVSKLEGEFP